MIPDPYDHVRAAFHTVADGLMDWRDPPILLKRTPTERTLRAVERLEKAADSLMRLGDTPNAIALYTLALRLRGTGGFSDE